MKIQSINAYTNYGNRGNICSNSSDIQNNQTSFRAMPASASEILSAKLRAQEVEQDAQKIVQKAAEYVPIAYENLGIAKTSYLKAVEYADIVKKSVKEKEFNIGDKHIEAISTLKKGKVQPISIKVFDDLGNNIQDIYYNNSQPVRIVDYISPETARITSFNGDRVVISDELNTLTNRIGTGYTFLGGKLATVKTNITNIPFASYADDFYSYVNDRLFVCERDTKALFTGSYKVKNRYSFQNERLINYYQDFYINEYRNISWKESCHYNSYKFIGRTKDANQESNNKPIKAQIATFLAGNKFVTARDIFCEIGDNMIANFLDKTTSF